MEAAGNRGGKMKAVRVMIAHSDEAVSEKLRSIIEADPRVAVVATAGSGEDCLKKVGITWPTVVVMDLGFADMVAAKVIQKLSQTRVPLAVLICSQDADKDSPILQQALQAGAYNYILLPRSVSEIDTIGRQILTTIHVTGFSKTKNIPQVDPGVEVKSDAQQEQHSALNLVILDVAPQHLTSVSWVLCRVHPQGEPAVLTIIRQPAPAAQSLLQEIGPKLHTQAEPFAPGAALARGRIMVLDEGNKGEFDLIAGLDAKDRVILQDAKGNGVRRGANGPNPVRLYATLADHYGSTMAVVLFGKPSPDTADAMIAAKERGALTLAYEQSTDLLTDIDRRFGDRQIPDDIVTLAQIDRFMNAVLLTKKA